MGEKPKMRAILQNSHYSARYKLSHKLLVRQTSNNHHWDWHVPNPVCTDFQVISSSSSWSKTNLLTFVHNEADDTDATDNADAANDYNRMIGIVLMKAFSCANTNKLISLPIATY